MGPSEQFSTNDKLSGGMGVQNRRQRIKIISTGSKQNKKKKLKGWLLHSQPATSDKPLRFIHLWVAVGCSSHLNKYIL